MSGAATSREGYVSFRGYRTWYRIVGEQTAPEKLPLLCLHGGPGATSYYLEPLAAMADTGRQVIFYDQLGCGRSDQPSDPSMWTVELFVDEVQTGMFRTGPFVRSREMGLAPDLLTIGKGTSDMMFPFALTLHSGEVQQRLDQVRCRLNRHISAPQPPWAGRRKRSDLGDRSPPCAGNARRATFHPLLPTVSSPRSRSSSDRSFQAAMQ